MQDITDSEKKASWIKRLMARIGTKRLIIGAVVILAGLWIANVLAGWIAGSDQPTEPVAVRHVSPAPPMPPAPQEAVTVKAPATATPPDIHQATAEGPKDAYSTKEVAVETLPAPVQPKAGHGQATTAAPNPAERQEAAPAAAPFVKGVAFVDALIAPLSYELNDRFWGWRPNDVINVTDNVNNFQLGTLEVTRRTIVVLTERISRTGSTAAFDKDLESAMNWLMMRPTQYWFPSPESMYGDALKGMTKYRDRIIKGGAPFYTRSDNLIPLLIAYEDLLGSSDENLVKHYEANGDSVSFFKADDYFFYAKGVASAMHPILSAVAVDFAQVLEARRGTDVIHRAIESLELAMEISPIVITNSDLSGILANHRANMAAPISHARFFLGVLIKTLST